MKYYTEERRSIYVNNFLIVIKFEVKDFEKLYERAFLKRSDLVEKNEGTDWLFRNLVGKITKVDLDVRRSNSLNSLDMMQNSNIFYHPESINETNLIL